MERQFIFGVFVKVYNVYFAGEHLLKDASKKAKAIDPIFRFELLYITKLKNWFFERDWKG